MFNFVESGKRRSTFCRTHKVERVEFEFVASVYWALPNFTTRAWVKVTAGLKLKAVRQCPTSGNGNVSQHFVTVNVTVRGRTKNHFRIRQCRLQTTKTRHFQDLNDGVHRVAQWAYPLIGRILL